MSDECTESFYPKDHERNLGKITRSSSFEQMNELTNLNIRQMC